MASPMLWPTWSPMRRVFGTERSSLQSPPLLPPPQPPAHLQQPGFLGELAGMALLPPAPGYGDMSMGPFCPGPVPFQYLPADYAAALPPCEFASALPPCEFPSALPAPCEHLAPENGPATFDGVDFSYQPPQGPHMAFHGDAFAAQMLVGPQAVAGPALGSAAGVQEVEPEMAGGDSAWLAGGMESGMAVGDGAWPATGAEAGYPPTSSSRKPSPVFTVFWVGERAFRAAPAKKEQVASMGFRIRIYRNHEKCRRAVEKEPQALATSVFVASAADAEPLVTFLSTLSEHGGVWVVVENTSGSPTSRTDIEQVASLFPEGSGSQVVAANTWEEILATLGSFGADAIASGVAVHATAASLATSKEPIPPRVQPDNVWTLFWVNDNAFKPGNTWQRAELEALGCQVKGYKTQRNAGRALDKKKIVGKCVVLVSVAEAAAMGKYLQQRPDLDSVKVVIEADKPEDEKLDTALVQLDGFPTQVSHSFHESVQAVRAAVQEAGW